MILSWFIKDMKVKNQFLQIIPWVPDSLYKIFYFIYSESGTQGRQIIDSPMNPTDVADEK